jgi:membrane-associated phospholipid phosphatase
VKKLLIFIFFAFGLTRASSQDSTQIHNIPARWYQSTIFKTAAAPVLLMGYGVSVLNVHGWPVSSTQAQGYMVKTFPGFHTHVDDFLAFSPAALALGLKLSGVKTRDNLTDGFFIYAISFALSEGIVQGLKYSTRELRPDGSDFQSFPSAHTAISFAGAEFVHQEYIDQSPWISIGGYGLAITTGAFRMMNNKHWLSDVAFGAGVGILSTKLIYLLYPKIKRVVQRR